MPIAKEMHKAKNSQGRNIRGVGVNYYRELISEGFEKRAPSRQAPGKHACFPIDDPVTRTLAATKYSLKAIEYSITVANAFFASVIKASLDDAIAANDNKGDPETVFILLGQVQANMAAIEDMHRDRMLFLDLISDPTPPSPKETSQKTSFATTYNRACITREDLARATRSSRPTNCNSSRPPSSLPQKQLPTAPSPPRRDRPQAHDRPATTTAGQLIPAQILRRRKRQLQRE